MTASHSTTVAADRHVWRPSPTDGPDRLNRRSRHIRILTLLLIGLAGLLIAVGPFLPAS
jgi:hypothetical protein